MHWITFDILHLLVIKKLLNAFAPADGLWEQKEIAPNALCWLHLFLFFYSGSKKQRADFKPETGLLPETDLNCKGDFWFSDSWTVHTVTAMMGILFGRSRFEILDQTLGWCKVIQLNWLYQRWTSPDWWRIWPKYKCFNSSWAETL